MVATDLRHRYKKRFASSFQGQLCNWLSSCLLCNRSDRVS